MLLLWRLREYWVEKENITKQIILKYHTLDNTVPFLRRPLALLTPTHFADHYKSCWWLQTLKCQIDSKFRLFAEAHCGRQQNRYLKRLSVFGGCLDRSIIQEKITQRLLLVHWSEWSADKSFTFSQSMHDKIQNEIQHREFYDWLEHRSKYYWPIASLW